MDISLIFSLLSGVCILLAYIVYNKDAFLGLSKPNAVSWGLWTMVTILNMASYFVMTGDILKNSLPIVASFACITTFGLALYKKNYVPLSTIEKLALTTGVIAIIGWYLFRSAVFANVILQLANAAAFVPTYRSVWKNPANEKPLPWGIFTTAYALLCITVLLRFDGKFAELLFPFLGLILHSSLTTLIIFRKRYSVQNGLAFSERL
jgi:hypothetical protein